MDVTELRERIDREIDLPSGYSVVFGGQFENQQRTGQAYGCGTPVARPDLPAPLLCIPLSARRC